MTTSDWLSIALSLAGVIVGIGISWVFYRAQQQTDFNKLIERLAKIGEGVEAIKSYNSITDEIGLDRTLSGFQNSIDSLGKDVNGLSSRILSDIRGEQRELLRAVQSEFATHVEQSRRVLEQAMSRELAQLMPTAVSKDAVISRLAELFKHAIQSLGEFQRTTIEKQSEVSLNKVESKLVEKVGEVSNDVQDIKSQLAALPLPPPAPAALR